MDVKNGTIHTDQDAYTDVVGDFLVLLNRPAGSIGNNPYFIKHIDRSRLYARVDVALVTRRYAQEIRESTKGAFRGDRQRKKRKKNLTPVRLGGKETSGIKRTTDPVIARKHPRTSQVEEDSATGTASGIL